MVRRFARPYARAIMDVAGAPDKANALREELQRFEDARLGASDLQALYANPGIPAETQLNITQTIAGRLGLSALAVRVVEVLVRNHRINDLGAILEALTTYVNEALNVAVAEVRTAHALSAAEQADLQKTLERKAGKRVEVHLSTDPTLLGGFVAKIGSEIFDASVSGKIHKFRDSLA